MSLWRWGFALLVVFIPLKAQPYKSFFLRKDKKLPLVISAQHVFYDQKKIKAHGHVMIQQEGDCLYADHLIYDESKDQLWVYGHVRLQDGEGNFVFCEKAFLKHHLKEGVLQQLLVLSQEKERLTARRAQRWENKEELEMASYTPCPQCQDTLHPTWSLHAEKIIHDSKTLTFWHTYLQFFGVPTVYLPYFYFPTQRSSGILSPYLSINSNLGTYFGLPYYWAIAKDKDLKITPFIMSKGGPMLAMHYRQQWNHSALSLQGAINRTPNSLQTLSYRGFVQGNMNYHMSKNWRFRAQEWWTSDKTFLSTRRFFGASQQAYLESQTKIEGFYPHHFIQVRGLRYQGLQEQDHSTTTPHIYPEVRYFYNSPPLWKKSIFLAHLNTLSLYKRLGNQMQRLLADASWHIPMITTWGQNVEFFVHANAALYRVRLQKEIWDSPKSHDTVGRFFPQAGLRLKWPFHYHTQALLTPWMQVICAPAHVKKYPIPNEDSQSIRFDDTNLFAKNRYMGFDRLSPGSRLDYGFECLAGLNPEKTLSFFMGQSYAFSQQDSIFLPVGVRKAFSDLVGRASVNTQYGQLFYRFRLDQKNHAMKFQEILWKLGIPQFMFSGSYAFYKKSFASSYEAFLNECNQMSAMVSSQVTRYWNVQVFCTKNFKTEMAPAQFLGKGVGFAYQDECFTFRISVQRTYYHALDLKPGYNINFYVELKNIGHITHQQSTLPLH